VSWLPSLGPRGEGWFAAQLVIFAAIALAGAAGPAWSGAARVVSAIVGLLLIGAGSMLALLGALYLGSNLTPFPAPRRDGHLVDGGVYRLVRHPIYGGLILGALGWGLATASPLAILGAIGLAIFFDVKSRLEEHWLAARYPGYEEYQSRTLKFVPWIY
jgi:protein-S-isoprenylcysteine O-methyltransferase Ste14